MGFKFTRKRGKRDTKSLFKTGLNLDFAGGFEGGVVGWERNFGGACDKVNIKRKSRDLYFPGCTPLFSTALENLPSHEVNVSRGDCSELLLFRVCRIFVCVVYYM